MWVGEFVNQAESARILAFVVVLALVSMLAAHSVGQNGKSSSRKVTAAPLTQRISSSAIWLPGTDFLKSAHAACDRNSSDPPALCLIREMAKAGAPSEAVQFSRQLYRENGSEFGVMLRFQALGPVDMAKVFYPQRDVEYKYAVGSRNVALLLVNGNPRIIDVDDLKKLDKHGMEQDDSYQFLMRRFPDLELWGGGRGGTMWETVHKRLDGGQSFDIYYVLNAGRPAGRWTSGANFAWNFDAVGNFLGTKFIGGVGVLPD
jgi:hypothetical protein